MITFIRHGQSIGNLKKIFLGHTDLDLSETGYKQAELTAEYMENYDIDIIYSSDLKRAYNTIKPLAGRKNMDIIKNTGFREIYAGKWEGLEYDEIERKYASDYYIWHHDFGRAVCTGGESVAELQKRVVAEYERISKLHKGQNVLIGTHAGAIRVLKCYILGMPLKDAYKIPWSLNASVTVIDNETNKILLDGYAEHLENLKTLPSINM